ncbi:hypothetical protein VTJ04DRAFT_7802 [Mycothermus thermophilus]|uniref:uncharacterized protein n=1 Tax=Humicola insolens TaxID=85995 RepID=UPI003743AD99
MAAVDIPKGCHRGSSVAFLSFKTSSADPQPPAAPPTRSDSKGSPNPTISSDQSVCARRGHRRRRRRRGLITLNFSLGLSGLFRSARCHPNSASTSPAPLPSVSLLPLVTDEHFVPSSPQQRRLAVTLPPSRFDCHTTPPAVLERRAHFNLASLMPPPR